ncbi:MAG: molybdopterin converting factor subunit 1 [Anaerolineae bacterium]|nr:molybdopterin converting factor subunit 1 [Anaerolineae bacterium]MDW8170965.1 molybdopterin converting factor subunit 1 [Anaerolineae bacterium]
MRVRVVLFATLKDLLGQRQLDLALEDGQATVDAVRQALMTQYPQASANLSAALAAVNEEFASADDPVRDGDEVAFFPPVSGGDGLPEIFILNNNPIDHDDLIARITTPQTGAVVFFSGLVRGETQREGHLPQTEYLEYEAYEPMALAKMRQVAQEVRQRWPKVIGIAIVQRIGRLEVGQNTVLIACSASHRDDGCFEAARYGIDRLKEIVPVWKKEVTPQAQRWIEGEYRPGPADRA